MADTFKNTEDWVYIAGPYANPDPVENTHNAVQAWNYLSDRGVFAICPHISLLTHLISPRPVKFWYDYDLVLLYRCDYMLRIPGESSGADKEEEFAKRFAIPVFTGSPEDFYAWYSGDV